MNAARIAAPEIDRTGRDAPDADLVAAVRAGDEDAFAELYRRYQPSVARFVRGRVRDHGRAEDVVQEAFVSALRRMRETDSELAFRAWIFEIARNASIDLYRRSSRTEEVSMDAVGGLAQADASRLGGTPGPDASLLGKESFDNFRGALDELSATHHRIIVMRELEGRSYREIGERMELSQAAVESTLFRARRKLEHEYEQLDSGHRCRLVGAAIGRLAEGMESPRDRLRLDRHARRCSACRRQARQLGVEPLLGALRGSIAARAAAFLPLPGFMRRRWFSADSGDAVGSGVQHGAGQLGAAFTPSIDVAGGVVGKAVATIAAVTVIGGGGATLGGAGPLAVGGQGVPPPGTQTTVPDRRDRDSAHPAATSPPSGDRPDSAAAESSARRAAASLGSARRSGMTDESHGRLATTGGSHGGPAAAPSPAAPASGDQPVSPSADLPPADGPAGGGSGRQGLGVAVPAPSGPLRTVAPAASPPSAQVVAVVPDVELPPPVPEPAGVVGVSPASSTDATVSVPDPVAVVVAPSAGATAPS